MWEKGDNRYFHGGIVQYLHMNEQGCAIRSLPEDSNLIALFYADTFNMRSFAEPLESFLTVVGKTPSVEAVLLMVRR